MSARFKNLRNLGQLTARERRDVQQKINRQFRRAKAFFLITPKGEAAIAAPYKKGGWTTDTGFSPILMKVTGRKR